MTTTDPTAGPQIVSGDYDEASAHYDAMLREIESREMAAIDAEIIDDLRAVLGLSPGQSLTKAVTQLRDDLARLRSQLAEAREQRDQAAEALVRAETERDEARAEIARLERAAHEQGADLWIAEDRLDRLRRQVLAVAEDLERYASDLRPERLPMSERKLAWTLRQIAGEAPETGPTAPQTGEQTGVRVESHTEPQTGSQGPLDIDAIRAAWLRACGPCDAGYPTACSCPPGDPRNVIAALVAEIDRLRTALNSQGGSR